MEVKLTKKNLGGWEGWEGGQNWVQNSIFCHFLKFASLVFLALDCTLGECLTSSRAEISKKKLWFKLGPNRPKSKSKWVSSIFFLTLSKEERGNLIKLIFQITWLHRISFTYKSTASFFRYRTVEWPWIKFKTRPTLFKKSWNLFYSNVARHPDKLAYFIRVSFL